MTHLVEMQRSLPKLEAAGVKLFGISYDEPDALADFARHHGIEYPLLSDRDSRVIREYGILNTNVEEHQVPFYGIPYPGTYVTDEEGRVIAKFFPRHIAMRDSAEAFIDSALGEIFVADDEPRASGGDDDIPIEVVFHGGHSLKMGIQRRIVVRFHLPEGLHIYGEPVPDGMVATKIEISGPEGLHVYPPILPPTDKLHLEALDAELEVWSGRVDIAVPIWADDQLAPLQTRDDPGSAHLEVTVRYQACDDTSCQIPRTEAFELDVPIEVATTPRLPVFRSNPARSTMPSVQHFLKMLRRGIARKPWLLPRTIAYMLGQMRAVRKGAADRERP